VHQTVRDRKETEAFSCQKGLDRKVALRTWQAQPGFDKAAMDDDFQEVDVPLYYSDPKTENENH
jgi:hypothetical protein